MLLKNTKAVLPIDWPINNILAFSTTRHSPSSVTAQSIEPSSFGQFNLGLHVVDNAEQVLQNRQWLAQQFPTNTQVQWLEQVHGEHVHIAKQYSPQPVTADAIFTQEKNVALAIMTADCLPLLISNQKGNEIAAIHGGWKPLSKNIIKKTLNYFSMTSRYFFFLSIIIYGSVF